MKKLILSAALLALAVFTCNAQNVGYAGNLTGGTNNVSAASTNTYYYNVIVTNVVAGVSTNYVTNVVNQASWVVKDARTISIQPTFALNAAGTTAVPITFDNSVDGASWNKGVTNMSITPAGATYVTGILTLDTGGVMFWRVGTVADLTANTGAITNLAVAIGKRTGL
jgi:hypothetical protein